MSSLARLPTPIPIRNLKYSSKQMPSTKGSWAKVLWVFLRLGFTSFGGPVAHIGYFRSEFVERRRWLDEKTYVDLVALCQFLPGHRLNPQLIAAARLS